ncbi:sensor histidine kinase [Cystobacter ferrugineus]|uniref:histidine kinase n=1 Tax=Cystobacter ferrugineus TaxID=83449 RepID=A0A1L9B4A8_9BACT|nr:sensor histidine kinase [Cystobacter ferrugineus]OJH37074.1 hypothetical protein BON30_31840 [Cystobacter ferrugineus]
MANSIGFKFNARVLVELGAELISSDSVAIYELVKNSLDAKSKTVDIHVDVALPYSAYDQLMGALDSGVDLKVFHEGVRNHVEEAGGTPEVQQRFFEKYGVPSSRQETQKRLHDAYVFSSCILVKDSGSGMGMEELEQNYMTVGTPVRRAEKTQFVELMTRTVSRLHFRYDKAIAGIPLGEKGIGRLAAMRLGHYIRVKTKKTGEQNWNILLLDWREAFADIQAEASSLVFKAVKEPCESTEIGSSGTWIYIHDLQADWSPEKISSIVRADLAKMKDVYTDFRANKFMRVQFQGKEVKVPSFDREPLNHADAVCEARLEYNDKDQPVLRMFVDYRRLSSQNTDTLEGDHLRACVREEPSRKKAKKKDLLVDAEFVAKALESLGPWEMKFYWFNRGRLMRDNPPLYENAVKGFLNDWGGGFLVYRDGYRVYPYGERSDDWLDLDRKALSSSAYKLNRAQMVGYLRISSIANPKLQDQTNREGFRNSYEKEALRRLLRYVILGFCKAFLEDVERKKEPPLDEVVTDVENRISTSKDGAIKSLKAIRARVPQESDSVGKVMEHLEEVSEAWERAKLRIENFEEDLDRFMHLAGVGLMLEFIAHELARVTHDTLQAVAAKKFSPQVIEAQLKTLDRRVRILDELSIPGRQQRRENDVNEVVSLLVEFHANRAAREQIEVKVVDEGGKGSFRETFEKGQILQILDNLLNNSFYWISNQLNPSEPGQITITLDRRRREIRFRDNGPGIPKQRSEQIFEQFFTTKPPQAGRGLGLYIARRLAQENKASLSLGPPDADGLHRVFILKFGVDAA